MSRPKTPSELHPEYPKAEPVTYTYLTGRDPVTRKWCGINTVSSDPTWSDRAIAFYAAHPEYKDEPSYEFLCGMCGDAVCEDHQYCPGCGDHSGEWMLVDADGGVVES